MLSHRCRRAPQMPALSHTTTTYKLEEVHKEFLSHDVLFPGNTAPSEKSQFLLCRRDSAGVMVHRQRVGFGYGYRHKSTRHSFLHILHMSPNAIFVCIHSRLARNRSPVPPSETARAYVQEHTSN